VDPVVRLIDVGVVHDERWILRHLGFELQPGQHWVVLGPNGSGKTTFVQVIGLYRHPSCGTVDVSGQRLGRGMDVRAVRTRIALSSAALAAQIRDGVTARDVVMTARHGALEAWWHSYSHDDRARAEVLLDRFGCGGFGDRAWGTLSSGERQRVLLARLAEADPLLMIFDEPTAGLDLRGREEFMANLSALAGDQFAPPTVMVTHHVEEIHAGATHALLLRDGAMGAMGPIAQVLTGDALSEAMGLEVTLEVRDGRYSARARNFGVARSTSSASIRSSKAPPRRPS
jgi:iron complex transport system ATP-binding protein